MADNRNDVVEAYADAEAVARKYDDGVSSHYRDTKREERSIPVMASELPPRASDFYVAAWTFRCTPCARTPCRSIGAPAMFALVMVLFFFSSRRRHTSSLCDWSSDVCSSDLRRFDSSVR